MTFDGSGDVATGSVEALDEARADRVHPGGQDDGDGAGGVLRRTGRHRARRQDNVDGEAPYGSPKIRLALPMRSFSRTLSLTSSWSKSASQRSGVMKG